MMFGTIPYETAIADKESGGLPQVTAAFIELVGRFMNSYYNEKRMLIPNSLVSNKEFIFRGVIENTST